jgi:uncharacterized membrane protein YeaQ/YmgE (transglycosylase-associated protein family)
MEWYMIRQIILAASLLMLGCVSALAQEPTADVQVQASIGFLGMLVIGILAGWIAEKVTASDHGLLTNLLVGIAGSFVGGTLAQLMSLQFEGWIGNLLVAAVGAILLLFVWRAITSQRTM